MNSWNATNISQWIKQVNGRKLDASQLKVDKSPLKVHFITSQIELLKTMSKLIILLILYFDNQDSDQCHANGFYW